MIHRRGKLIGSIVSAEHVAKLEDAEPASRRGGLLATVGALADVDDWPEIMQDVMTSRATRADREVEFE